jgi:hypothetical protein
VRSRFLLEFESLISFRAECLWPAPKLAVMSLPSTSIFLDVESLSKILLLLVSWSPKFGVGDCSPWSLVSNLYLEVLFSKDFELETMFFSRELIVSFNNLLLF